MDNPPRVLVKRAPGDWQVGETSLSDLDGFRIDTLTGGALRRTAPLLYAYVSCDRIDGEIGHSCMHGDAPHRIKVFVPKTVNKRVWHHIESAIKKPVDPK